MWYLIVSIPDLCTLTYLNHQQAVYIAKLDQGVDKAVSSELSSKQQVQEQIDEKLTTKVAKLFDFHIDIWFALNTPNLSMQHLLKHINQDITRR